MADNRSNVNSKGDCKRLYWDGTLSELKQFITEELKLSGTWKSPGGDIKLFTNESLWLKWQGRARNGLLFQANQSRKAI